MPILLRVVLPLILTAPLLAHGGQYRGPSGVTAPGNHGSPGTSQNKTNGNTVPGNNTPGAPGSPGGAGGTTGATGARGSAGAVPLGFAVGDDLGRWEFWWEFGKDPYLRLRDTIYSDRSVDPGQALWNPRLAAGMRNVSPPNAKDVRAVASQLASLLSSSTDRDTSSACLLALAKIGPTQAGFDLIELFTPFLARGDQELRESAAIALGISGSLDQETQQILADLIEDSIDGRNMSGKTAVNERTRAFAAYASGLLLHRSREAGSSMRLTRPLQGILNHPADSKRNLMVAAIEALALFPRDWQSKAAGTLRDAIVQDLGRYYDRDLGAGNQLIQAHVPTAIARLLPSKSIQAIKWRERFAADLTAGLRSSSASNSNSNASAKVNHHVAQSCALALGSMCDAWDDENSASREIGKLLVRVHQDHRDQQTRSFAALALARIGGKQPFNYLVSQLHGANKAIEQPWLAMSLGVIAAKQRIDGSHEGKDAADFERLTKALLKQFGKARNPGTIGALAIALGLTGAPEARDVLRRTLVEQAKRDDVAGYVALALGLLQDARAIPDLRVLRKGSVGRTFVMMQSVRALGLLGDHTLTEQLNAELAAPGVSLIRLSAIASALAQIGDRRSLPALQKLMADQDVAPLTQAFAAVALGGVCDKDALPWNSVYATHVNYRASTETLTDGRAGILDLL
ncbi:MAG: HEAT repeat protein [Planctomycetota bacterium]|jgi:HEAT repeat protein